MWENRPSLGRVVLPRLDLGPVQSRGLCARSAVGGQLARPNRLVEYMGAESGTFRGLGACQPIPSEYDVCIDMARHGLN